MYPAAVRPRRAWMSYALVDLPPDIPRAGAVARREGVVSAEGASAGGDRAVAVGACESRVNRYFLHTFQTRRAAQILRVCRKSPFHVAKIVKNDAPTDFGARYLANRKNLHNFIIRKRRGGLRSAMRRSVCISCTKVKNLKLLIV